MEGWWWHEPPVFFCCSNWNGSFILVSLSNTLYSIVWCIEGRNSMLKYNICSGVMVSGLGGRKC